MELYPDTLQKARDQGLSDDEIKTHLSADKRFSTAFEKGLSLEDIATHFDQKLKAQPVQVQYDTQPPNENDLAVSREAAGASVPTTFEKIKKVAFGSLIPEHKINEYAEKARSIGEKLPDFGITALMPLIVGKDVDKDIKGEIGSRATRLAADFVSPFGIATLGLGALPKLVQKAVAFGFAGDVMLHAPEKYEAIVNAKTTKEKTGAIFDAVAATGMVAAPLAHVSGRPSVGGELLKSEAGLERTKEFQDKLAEVTARSVDSTISEVAKSEPPPPPPTGEQNATQEGLQPKSDQQQYPGRKRESSRYFMQQPSWPAC